MGWAVWKEALDAKLALDLSSQAFSRACHVGFGQVHLALAPGDVQGEDLAGTQRALGMTRVTTRMPSHSRALAVGSRRSCPGLGTNQ